MLTGTPLQNDLSELWSLLNLLLPQVFDNAKVFQQWFGDDGKKSAAGAGGEGEDWMEKEKKIIVISRLHQILEPFMLRRLVQDVERKLPAKITIAVHCPFSAYQAAVYDWVNKTGTLRVHPTMSKIGLAARQNFKGYLALQNRCMELRKVCNHPALNYPTDKGGEWRTGEDLVRTCGKLWMLDRMLIKLRAAGPQVLLFSTMTKLLDLLETYLKWRMTTPAGEGLEWCRIDGSTALDLREEAITAFNAPGSKKFIFLLSIRAAGRVSTSRPRTPWWFTTRTRTRRTRSRRSRGRIASVSGGRCGCFTWKPSWTRLARRMAAGHRWIRPRRSGQGRTRRGVLPRRHHVGDGRDA